MHVQITGETQHVGPTPMERRLNALVGAGYLIADVNEIGWKYYEDGDGKTTVTRIECHPNLFGIIPDSVKLTIDFRHPDGERMNDMFEEIQAGHDAYAIARVAPTCMILTPCREGYTHNVKEEIELDKTVPGVNLLLNAATRRANR